MYLTHLQSSFFQHLQHYGGRDAGTGADLKKAGPLVASDKISYHLKLFFHLASADRTESALGFQDHLSTPLTVANHRYLLLYEKICLRFIFTAYNIIRQNKVFLAGST